jgi:hypothetical protein
MALDDFGDMQAPEGSPAWARAMRGALHDLSKQSTTQLRRFRDYLAHMERGRGYQQLDNEFGHPFPSLKAFCAARPPFGLGYDPDLIEAIQHETRDMLWGDRVAEHVAQKMAQDPEVKGTLTREEAGALGGRGHKAIDNVNSFPVENHQGGNSALYLVKRLKRDHPEIAEALAQGKYPSARAAAKAAGIPVADRTVYLPCDPTKAAQTLATKFPTTFLRAMVVAWQQEGIL